MCGLANSGKGEVLLAIEKMLRRLKGGFEPAFLQTFGVQAQIHFEPGVGLFSPAGFFGLLKFRRFSLIGRGERSGTGSLVEHLVVRQQRRPRLECLLVQPGGSEVFFLELLARGSWGGSWMALRYSAMAPSTSFLRTYRTLPRKKWAGPYRGSRSIALRKAAMAPSASFLTARARPRL